MSNVEHDLEHEEEDFLHHQHKEKDADQYVWERKFTGGWDLLPQGGGAGAESADAMRQHMQLLEQRRKRQNRLNQQNVVTSVVRRGILRYMYLIIDLGVSAQQLQNFSSSNVASVAAATSAGLPHGSSSCIGIEKIGVGGGSESTEAAVPAQYIPQTRQNIVLKRTLEFVREFFDQNPLSQLGIIVTRNGYAEKLCELTSRVKKLEDALREKFQSSGQPSLQNALEMALEQLNYVPSYGFKEVVILYSSLGTCDPADINKTIRKCKDTHLRCSVVAFGAEVYVLKYLTRETGGSYHIPISEENFKDRLFAHATPPPTPANAPGALKNVAEMIAMGFPQRRSENMMSMCMCHGKIRPGGYQCPRCLSRYCEIPTDCTICGLKLVSSPLLARSYHHLFPVQPFVELDAENRPIIESERDAKAIEACLPDGLRAQDLRPTQQENSCFACQKMLMAGSSLRLLCPKCRHVFCVECDSFIHTSIYNCPGCE